MPPGHIGSRLHLELLSTEACLSHRSMLDCETPRRSVFLYISCDKQPDTQQTRHPRACLSHTHTNTAIPGVGAVKGMISPWILPGCLFDIPEYVIHMQPGGVQSKRCGHYIAFVNFPFIHFLPTLPLCLCLSPLPTTHLPSFTSASLYLGVLTHELSVFACNTNYCALLGSGEQRGDIGDVWRTAV